MDKLLVKIFTDQNDALLRTWLATTLERQLAEQGITGKPNLIDALVERALAGFDGEDEFTWTDDDEDEPEGAPLPLTDDGYWSDFVSPAEVSAAGGPKALAFALLSEFSNTQTWRVRCARWELDHDTG